jgi:effector-binding domain-containing protein
MTTTAINIPDNALVATETAPFTALGFTTRTTLTTISAWNHVPGELLDEAARLGLTIAGPIQYIYTGVNGNDTNVFQLDIVLPVKTAGPPAETFDYRYVAGFPCLSYRHTGHWDTMPAVYDQLFGQLHAGGRKNDGHVREVYHVVNTEAPGTCVTEVQIGLA